MSTKLNLSERLDFNDIDLTAPEIVVGNILKQLPEETNGLIEGSIGAYHGPVMSYKEKGLSGIAQALGTVEREVDIQEQLGKIGAETHKFECCLYTPEYDKYKYRLLFLKYNVANYPVTVILDESVSRSISVARDGYIQTCNTPKELEELLVSVLTSKRVVCVMQELIRVNQSKRENATENSDITE